MDISVNESYNNAGNIISDGDNNGDGNKDVTDNSNNNKL